MYVGVKYRQLPAARKAGISINEIEFKREFTEEELRKTRKFFGLVFKNHQFVLPSE